MSHLTSSNSFAQDLHRLSEHRTALQLLGTDRDMPNFSYMLVKERVLVEFHFDNNYRRWETALHITPVGPWPEEFSQGLPVMELPFACPIILCNLQNPSLIGLLRLRGWQLLSLTKSCWPSFYKYSAKAG